MKPASMLRFLIPVPRAPFCPCWRSGALCGEPSRSRRHEGGGGCVPLIPFAAGAVWPLRATQSGVRRALVEQAQ